MGNAANVSSAVLPGQDQHVLDFQATPRAFSLSISAVAAAILVSAGILVLAAWILDLDAVKSLSPSWVTMKVNAALSFILSGVTLHLLTGGSGDSRTRLAGRVAAAMSVVVGALTFGQYLSGIDLRIDELLMQQPTTAVDMARPGRMAAAAAIGFMLLGTALLCHGSGGTVARAVSVGLALVLAAMAFVVVATYLVDVESLYAQGPLTSMALHTAVLFGVGALGIVAARPDKARANGHRAALAAAAAAEGASRRRVLFEQARDGIVVFDVNDGKGRVYEANASFAGLLGYTMEEIVLLHPWDWDAKHPTRELCLEAWREMPSTGGEQETQFRRKDGVVIDVAVSYTPATAGGTVCLYCVCRDVTEHRRAERALHESEERFRRALANIPDVVVIYDRELRIRYINNATRTITGLRSEDLVGRRDDEIFPAETCDVYLPALREARATKLIRKVESDITLPKIGSRTLRITCVPLLDRSGEVREILGITQDLTERKLAEEKIRRSEQQYRELIEQAADGIFISDHDGRFVLANTRCCDLLGYSRDELLGMRGSETWLGEETAVTSRRMALLASGEDLRYERMLKRKDGSEFPAEISVRMLDSGGMQVIFHDITTRHRHERKIARLHRIHAVLSGISSAIVRVRDRRQLLAEACRIAVEAGNFKMAWVGTVESGSGKARMLAQSGFPFELPGEGREAEARVDPVVDLMPNGPVSFSLREKRPVYENDIVRSAHLSGLRRMAIRHGAKSVIVLPLQPEDEIFGFLVLYAPERNFFDDEELKLLRELASDISFALELISKDEKLLSAEAALRDAAKQQ